MINEAEPAGLGADQPEQKWNTDEPAGNGLTCHEVSRFMNAYMTAFRLFSIAGSHGGLEAQMKDIIHLYEIQRRAVFDSGLKGKEKDYALNGLVIGIAAAGLAAISATGSISCEVFAELTAAAQETALGMLGKNPKALETGELRFSVRNSPEGMAVGCSVVSYEDLEKQLGDSPLIQSLMKQEKQEKQGDN